VAAAAGGSAGRDTTFAAAGTGAKRDVVATVAARSTT